MKFEANSLYSVSPMHPRNITIRISALKKTNATCNVSLIHVQVGNDVGGYFQNNNNNNNNNNITYLFTAIGLSPGGSGYFTCIQNMKSVTTKFNQEGYMRSM